MITIVNHLNSATAEGEGKDVRPRQDWALWFPERNVPRELASLPRDVTYHQPAGKPQGANGSPHTDLRVLPRRQEATCRLQLARISQLNSLQLRDIWFAILAETDWLTEDLDINWHHR